MEDEDKLTPCDLAERHQHTELALSLESQMVFSPPAAQQQQQQQQPSADAHGEVALLQYKEVRAAVATAIVRLRMGFCGSQSRPQ